MNDQRELAGSSRKRDMIIVSIQKILLQDVQVLGFLLCVGGGKSGGVVNLILKDSIYVFQEVLNLSQGQ